MRKSKQRTPKPSQSAQLDRAPLLASPWIAAGALFVATLLAYANSFQGDFVYDDVGHIVRGYSIRPVWPIWDVIRAGGPRWLLIWTLSINHALGGLDVWGYHAFNFTVHILSGLLLWSIVRELLRRPAMGAAFSQHASALAFAVALLWLVHPLQTQAVTYIVQRCESMMALCFLALLWCLVQSTERSYRYAWLCGAIASFWIGLGTKEVMATAPVVAIAFDRIYLAASWKELLRQRGWVYGVMLLPLVLVANKIPRLVFGDAAMNTGFGMDSLTWWQYALSQPAAILHYLRLVVVPYPLCIDYEWPVATTWQQIVLPGAALVSLLVLTAWSLWFHPRIGFLAFAFFIVLAPTSSIVPLADVAVEHRMYLPLAPVLVMLVLGGSALMQRLATARQWTMAERRNVMRLAVVAPAAVLMVLTYCRNADYSSALTLWRATVEVRPQNARANHNLCAYLVEDGRAEDAIAAVERSIARCEAIGWPTRRHYVVLGETLARLGRWDDAQAALVMATSDRTGSTRSTPAEKRLLAEAYLSLATATAAAGEQQRAERYFQQSLALRPDFAFGHALYGEQLHQQGRYEEAAARWSEAVRLQPDWFEVHRDLALVLTKLNQNDKALQELALAAKLRPEDADVARLLRELRAGQTAAAAP